MIFKKIIYIFTIIASYIPLVTLPILTMMWCNRIWVSALALVVWRLITYYKNIKINKLFSSKVFKTILCLFSILILIIPISTSLKIIINIYLFAFINTYCSINIKKMSITNNIRILLIMIGMFLGGLLLNNLLVFNIYLIINIIFVIWVGDVLTYNKINKVKFEANFSLSLMVAVHNFHYYIFAFLIPLLGYYQTSKLIFSGIFCVLNWILFFPGNNLIKNFQMKNKLKIVILIAYLISGISLIFIGISENIFVIFFSCLNIIK